ncbi:30S ribosome-binding factor RbfA [SAR202 cluster bacterium AD-804-J14_MRT_500m]|nr:30S ribosome-binding factor RbfA [SAR202 cluster bacterium AD-804-J14_MRT_500m]MQF69606.1 30S ribosome-binding factor RbfA [SAR202 cluster bacterium AD-804-J14_MRT_500m]
MNRRTLRVNELLRQEISVVLQREIRDPRLRALITVTKVETAPDLRQAKVYISVMGDSSKKAEALQGLTSAKGYLRRSIGEILPLRHVPSLSFVLDDTLEKGEVVFQVMNRLAEEQARTGSEDNDVGLRGGDE